MEEVNFDLVKESLRELADKDTRVRLWNSDQGLVSSFIEAVEGLFDDSGLELALQRNPEAFTAEAMSLLNQLQKEIKRVDAYMPPERLINDQRMSAVRRTASELLQLGAYVSE